MRTSRLAHLVLFLTLSQIACAETLLEKTQNGSELTAVDLTSIFLAEVKSCEDNVPGFRQQSDPYFTKLKSSEQFRKVINLIDAKQNAEATAVVAGRGVPSKASCDRTLRSIQSELSRLKSS